GGAEDAAVRPAEGGRPAAQRHAGHGQLRRLRRHGRRDELPAAAHDGGGTPAGAAGVVPPAVRARGGRGPAVGRPGALPRRPLPAADEAERPADPGAVGRPLLAAGAGGTAVLLGDGLGGTAAVAAEPRSGDRLPGDVRPFLPRPRGAGGLGPVGGGERGPGVRARARRRGRPTTRTPVRPPPRRAGPAPGRPPPPP